MGILDLDQKISGLYDFVYNKKDNNCIEIERIDDINNINTIKFTHKFKEYIDQIITNLLENEMKLEETTEKKIILKRYSDSTFPIRVVIGAYNSDNKNVNDLNRSENVEIAIKYLLSELVINNLTPHILLPICNLDLNSDMLEQFENKYSIIKKLRKVNDKNFYIHTSEHFFKMDKLSQVVKDNKCDLKNILFS